MQRTESITMQRPPIRRFGPLQIDTDDQKQKNSASSNEAAAPPKPIETPNFFGSMKPEKRMVFDEQKINDIKNSKV